MGWYTIVRMGLGPYTMPPRGPWYSGDAARQALSRWRDRVGALAGSIESAHTIRVVGPFPSRSVARAADISDYASQLTAPAESRREGWEREEWEEQQAWRESQDSYRIS